MENFKDSNELFFSLDNEKNNRLSPALSQSWIEDNIHEIISYKDDDIYDETNKQINVQNPIITLKYFYNELKYFIHFHIILSLIG